MRSMRAARLLRPLRRPLASRPSRPRAVAIRYCSSCEPAAPIADASPRPDHRQLAVEQELFTTSIYSPGSPLFLPNGTRVFNKMVAFLRAQYARFGFDEVLTPTIYKRALWVKSGHWDNYADDMFAVTGRSARGETADRELGEDEEYGLKPMNCPGHCLLFASQRRSFRDLPIRYADFSPLHRNEISGALSGLTRVRRFHQDDAHIFCRPAQIGEEISKTLDFVKLAYQTFRLGSYKLVLSTRPEDQYIGTLEEWDRAEAGLRDALTKSGQPWEVNPGDGAFYGPKIDIILTDSDGKEHQTATIQLDFQLPKRFGLEYQAPAPELEQKGESTEDPELLATYGNVTPVIVHRAIFGSVERFFALLIEHYNGRWPFWLAPRQVTVLTVTNDAPVQAYASRLAGFLKNGPARAALGGEAADAAPPRTLTASTLAVELDDSARPLKKKIAEAKAKHVNVVVVVGKRNLAQADGAGGAPTAETVNADFSATPDPDGLLAALVAAETGQAVHDVKLSSVQMTPTALRSVLCKWEAAYQ